MELISMKSFKNNDILYITPSHQFPTGYVMSLKKHTTYKMGTTKERTIYY